MYHLASTLQPWLSRMRIVSSNLYSLSCSLRYLVTHMDRWPRLSRTGIVQSMSCSSAMTQRYKVCTIHVVHFSHGSQEQGLYHPSRTIHAAHWCPLLHIWSVDHGCQGQGLYHPSSPDLPWLKGTRFVPSMSYTSAMALRNKVCTIHLVQFMLPIDVLCYTYGVLTMAARDKVCTIRLVQICHDSKIQGLCHPCRTLQPWLSGTRFVPSISYNSRCPLMSSVTHMECWPWLPGTRFVLSMSYTSAMALRNKVCTIHLVQFMLPIDVLCYTYGVLTMAARDKVCTIRLVQICNDSKVQGVCHPCRTLQPWLSGTRFVPSISYNSRCPLMSSVTHMECWPWLPGTRFVLSISYTSAMALGNKICTNNVIQFGHGWPSCTRVTQ